jgi:hypothetical protein
MHAYEEDIRQTTASRAGAAMGRLALPFSPECGPIEGTGHEKADTAGVGIRFLF